MSSFAKEIPLNNIKHTHIPGDNDPKWPASYFLQNVWKEEGGEEKEKEEEEEEEEKVEKENEEEEKEEEEEEEGEEEEEEVYVWKGVVQLCWNCV